MDEMVSVIIPIYNSEKYLKRCINSIIYQTYKNIEIILIDDGSTDRSSDICDHYSSIDSRVKTYHILNGGVSNARNYGLEISNGEYLIFVDSDDFVHREMIETLYQNIKENNADISIGNIYHTYKEKIIDAGKNEVVIWDNEHALKKILEAKETSFFPVAKLYKKNILNNIKFNRNYKLAEDALFITELYLDKSLKTVYTKKNLYAYYHHSNSATTDVNINTVFDTIKVHSIIFDKVSKKYPNLKSELITRRFWSYFVVLDKIILSDNEKLKIEARKLIKRLRNNFISIIKDKSFTKNRKISLCLLMLSQNLYKLMVKLNNRKYI